MGKKNSIRGFRETAAQHSNKKMDNLFRDVLRERAYELKNQIDKLLKKLRKEGLVKKISKSRKYKKFIFEDKKYRHQVIVFKVSTDHGATIEIIFRVLREEEAKRKDWGNSQEATIHVRTGYVIDELNEKVIDILEAADRGALTENIVDKILEELKKEEIIHDWDKTRDFEDRKGADHVLLFFSDDWEMIKMFLQDKSSWTGVQTHKKKFPNIPCVWRTSWSDTKEKIIEIINAYKKDRKASYI